MDKLVAIVVVTYNRLVLLKEVIESLRLQTFDDYKIIVVNNGSTDGTLEWLSKQSDIITITQDNLGGAGGFFSGIKYAAEHSYEYCWIMDDDVICEHTALEELVKAYSRKSNIGFVCSKVIGLDGCPMNTPVVDDRPSANGYADYLDLIDYGMIKVKTATFVSVFFSISVVKNLGLPYKEYFIWGDDAEYTQRISSCYDCYLATKSCVVHKRTIQGRLSFEGELDCNRLNNFFYIFRNSSFNNILYSEEESSRLKVFYKNFKYVFKLILKLDLFRASIVLRSSLAFLKFNPKVCYPNCKD